MSSFPEAVFDAEQVRKLDATAIGRYQIPGYQLMCRAGNAAVTLARDLWPERRRWVVLCGAGNNAGDGYVIARLARDAGVDVRVVALVDPERLKGDAAQAWSDFGGACVPWQPDCLTEADLCIDAMLGTGLDRTLDGMFRDAVAAVNEQSCPVLAVDIPTGLHADTGELMGSAVVAAHTITFVGLKAGLYLGCGPDHCGLVHFDGLGVPGEAARGLTPVMRRLTPGLLDEVLPRRRRSAHKGDHGRVLIVGGGPGMPGAVRLAGEAALRAGAGLVTVATHPAHAAIIVAGRPELICRPVASAAELEPLLAAADVVALGPGLGQTEWGRAMFAAALPFSGPMVVDADGLNHLAGAEQHRSDWVLTPHPGEAARLLGITSAAVQADRLAALAGLAAKFGGTIVLKGACTLVGSPGEVPWLCDRGNPGMATAGMGDVLTGVIAAIAAQGADVNAAARLGVLAHATAGDQAAEAGERGLLACDLMEPLRHWLNRGQ